MFKFMDSKKLGDFGEKIACEYLEKKGYRILDRNYLKKWSAVQKGEIDIVAKPPRTIFDILRGKKDETHFIEVKTLRQAQGEGFLAEDKVNSKKQKQLIKLAQIWLSEKKIPLDSQWQIDVIAITTDLNSKKAKIRHFKNAICQSGS